MNALNIKDDNIDVSSILSSITNNNITSVDEEKKKIIDIEIKKIVEVVNNGKSLNDILIELKETKKNYLEENNISINEFIFCLLNSEHLKNLDYSKIIDPSMLMSLLNSK